MMADSLPFNKKIYAKEAITESVRSFKDLADFKVSIKNNYFIVAIRNIDKHFKNTLKQEFANFVLAKTKELCTK